MNKLISCRGMCKDRCFDNVLKALNVIKPEALCFKMMLMDQVLHNSNAISISISML